MMKYYYLVQGNSVIGIGYETMTRPVNMNLVASEINLPPHKLYYDGTDIKPIPDKPEGEYIWTGTEWQPVQLKDISKSEPVSAKPLAVATYEHIKQIDEVLADTLAYLFARFEGDAEEINLRYQKLSKLTQANRRKINKKSAEHQGSTE